MILARSAWAWERRITRPAGEPGCYGARSVRGRGWRRSSPSQAVHVAHLLSRCSRSCSSRRLPFVPRQGHLLGQALQEVHSSLQEGTGPRQGTSRGAPRGFPDHQVHPAGGRGAFLEARAHEASPSRGDPAAGAVRGTTRRGIRSTTCRSWGGTDPAAAGGRAEQAGEFLDPLPRGRLQRLAPSCSPSGLPDPDSIDNGRVFEVVAWGLQ